MDDEKGWVYARFYLGISNNHRRHTGTCTLCFCHTGGHYYYEKTSSSPTELFPATESVRACPPFRTFHSLDCLLKSLLRFLLGSNAISLLCNTLSSGLTDEGFQTGIISLLCCRLSTKLAVFFIELSWN